MQDDALQLFVIHHVNHGLQACFPFGVERRVQQHLGSLDDRQHGLYLLVGDRIDKLAHGDVIPTLDQKAADRHDLLNQHRVDDQQHAARVDGFADLGEEFDRSHPRKLAEDFRLIPSPSPFRKATIGRRTRNAGTGIVV